MTWTTHHRRAEALRTVIAAADRRRDGRLPMDLDGVAEAFGDELSLLGALQLRWHTRLAGRIERELAARPTELEEAVVAAWRATAEELPGVRAILDHYRSAPLDAAMARAMTRAAVNERTLLAATAGRAGAQDPGAALAGAGIEERARAEFRPFRQFRDQPPRPGLLDRLRAVLAA
jgi:hypothetical protein